MIDFLEGQGTITASYYEGVLKKLKTSLAKKRLGKLQSQILFRHDNAPAHSSRVIRALPHPLYSLDLAPSHLFLFPKLKEYFKGTQFASLDEAKKQVISCCQRQPPQFYEKGIYRWKHRLQQWILCRKIKVMSY